MVGGGVLATKNRARTAARRSEFAAGGLRLSKGAGWKSCNSKGYRRRAELEGAGKKLKGGNQKPGATSGRVIRGGGGRGQQLAAIDCALKRLAKALLPITDACDTDNEMDSAAVAEEER